MPPPQDYEAFMTELNKPDKRDAYRERTGKTTYSLEVYASDKERMIKWLNDNGYKQADGFRVLLELAKIQHPAK